jgi:hypothetical protein
MDRATLKNVAELVGIIAVLATLILIWAQLRQTQVIAVAELNVSLVQARVDMSGLMTEHSDVWLRGSVGDSLTAVERVTFEEIAATLDTRWFVEHRQMLRLGEVEQAEALLNDYSAYLHERPGLRQAWLER